MTDNEKFTIIFYLGMIAFVSILVVGGVALYDRFDDYLYARIHAKQQIAESNNNNSGQYSQPPQQNRQSVPESNNSDLSKSQAETQTQTESTSLYKKLTVAEYNALASQYYGEQVMFDAYLLGIDERVVSFYDSTSAGVAYYNLSVDSVRQVLNLANQNARVRVYAHGIQQYGNNVLFLDEIQW